MPRSLKKSTQPAVGWLVGGKHDGIRQMFRVIEHARMLIGLKSAATLSTGYLNALDRLARSPIRIKTSVGPPSEFGRETWEYENVQKIIAPVVIAIKNLSMARILPFYVFREKQIIRQNTKPVSLFSRYVWIGGS